MGPLAPVTLHPQDGPAKAEIPMINVPGQRFTATHGIRAKKGEQKLFL